MGTSQGRPHRTSLEGKERGGVMPQEPGKGSQLERKMWSIYPER